MGVGIVRPIPPIGSMILILERVILERAPKPFSIGQAPNLYKEDKLRVTLNSKARAVSRVRVIDIVGGSWMADMRQQPGKVLGCVGEFRWFWGVWGQHSTAPF